MRRNVQAWALSACLCLLSVACSGEVSAGLVVPHFDAGPSATPDAGADANQASATDSGHNPDRDASMEADAASDAAQPMTDGAVDANPEPMHAVCGDGTLQGPDEECDDGNKVTESCAYGASECSVCDATCHKAAGAIHICGDGQRDESDEGCDDGNKVTESCAYGMTSCSICNSSCQTAAGATSYCGDGVISASKGEACDDHNRTAGDGCDADCHVEMLASCGNSVVDTGEECDDGNTTNVDGCNGACKKESGWACPTVGAACTETCGDQLVVGSEACDDGNQVDNDYCTNNCRTAHSCGDNSTQAGAGEQCDDGNQTTEACAYGQMSCTVCDANCHSVAGSVKYCGDGIVQAAQGEACDATGDMRCGTDCQIKCDTVYITYSLASTFQMAGTTGGMGDGSYPQTGGSLVLALPAGAAGPVDGPAGMTYLNSPVKMTQTYYGTTFATDLVGVAGTPSNKCRIEASTLSGSQMVRGACPYNESTVGARDMGGWTPAMQQVTAPNGPGCLEYNSTGTVTCTGTICAAAGLMSGANQTNAQWDQPGATLVFTNNFAHVASRALGTPTPAGSAVVADKVEVPNTVSGRSWISFDGTETSRTCEKKPTSCPTPGSQ